MAKDKEEMVQVPASVLQQLQGRVAVLEQQAQIAKDFLEKSPQQILDPDYEAWKAEASRPAAVRSQDVADRQYGKDGQRWRCWIDTGTAIGLDGKTPPVVAWLPSLGVAANTDLEAI